MLHAQGRRATGADAALAAIRVDLLYAEGLAAAAPDGDNARVACGSEPMRAFRTRGPIRSGYLPRRGRDALSPEVRYSRGAERHVKKSRRCLSVFEALGQDAERKRLDAGNGFVAILAIARSPRQVANLRDPPTVILVVEFDRKTHAHGRTVTGAEYRCRTTACTRPALMEQAAPAGEH